MARGAGGLRLLQQRLERLCDQQRPPSDQAGFQVTIPGRLVTRMRREQAETVREVAATREAEGAPLRRLPRRTAQSTKQMHERLLKALGDRRIKQSFS